MEAKMQKMYELQLRVTGQQPTLGEQRRMLYGDHQQMAHRIQQSVYELQQRAYDYGQQPAYGQPPAYEPPAYGQQHQPAYPQHPVNEQQQQQPSPTAPTDVAPETQSVAARAPQQQQPSPPAPTDAALEVQSVAPRTPQLPQQPANTLEINGKIERLDTAAQHAMDLKLAEFERATWQRIRLRRERERVERESGVTPVISKKRVRGQISR
jgi:hypothetical protein